MFIAPTLKRIGSFWLAFSLVIFPSGGFADLVELITPSYATLFNDAILPNEISDQIGREDGWALL